MHEITTLQIVNQLFDRLMAINPAWKQAWPTEEEFKSTKKEWVIAFVDAKINTIEQLKSGLKKIRLHPSPFVPSPGEFIELCKIKPQDIGAPSLDIAYKEAIKNAYPDGCTKNWTHPAIKYAYEKSDPYFLRTESYAKTFNRFSQNYQQACEDYAEGKIMNQLENKKTLSAYQEYVGKLKSDILLGLIPQNTLILNFEEWKKS